MNVIKAGCYVVNLDKRQIALVYRQKQKDYSFPKGHLENGESIEQCAIRETNEEIKRDVEIVKDIPPTIESYVTPSGEECLCYLFVALDKGVSKNDSQDYHPLIWADIDEVENVLSYDSLKQSWKSIKEKIEILLNSK